MSAPDKDVIAKRLNKIAGLHGGRLTPEAVIEDARSPKSPLHDQFEWDDSVAAQHWRTEQARQLIRSVTVQITTDTRTYTTPHYVRDPEAGSAQGYIAVAKLKTSKDLAREALRAELVQAEALFERALGIAEALALKEPIVDIQSRIADVRNELDKAA